MQDNPDETDISYSETNYTDDVLTIYNFICNFSNIGLNDISKRSDISEILSNTTSANVINLAKETLIDISIISSLVYGLSYVSGSAGTSSLLLDTSSIVNYTYSFELADFTTRLNNLYTTVQSRELEWNLLPPEPEPEPEPVSYTHLTLPTKRIV